MAKRELFDHRMTGPIMRACRHIEVDRADGERSLAVAREFLDRGEVVGIFPEATISRAMEIKDLKTGAARIAAAADVPLVPVVLWGTQRLMTKDHDKDFSRGKAITISVGAPVPLTGDAVADTASAQDHDERHCSTTRSAATRSTSRARGGSRRRTAAARRRWTRRRGSTSRRRPTRAARRPRAGA